MGDIRRLFHSAQHGASVALAGCDVEVFQREVLRVAYIKPVVGQVVIPAQRVGDDVLMRNARYLRVAVHVCFEHAVALVDIDVFIAIAVNGGHVFNRNVLHAVSSAVVFASHRGGGQIDVVCVDVFYRNAVDRTHFARTAVVLIQPAAQPHEQGRGDVVHNYVVHVYVGKVGTSEVDFAVQDYDGNLEYYQVAWSVRDRETLARELKPLDSISDHNPKCLLTMDNDPPASYNGIRQKYVLDWLLDIN